MECRKENPLIRGTTPIFRYNFRTIDPNLMRSCYLTIKQKDGLLCEKTLEEGTIGEVGEGCKKFFYISWQLTQEETLRIDPKGAVKFQIRFVMQDGSAYASHEKEVRSDDVLKEGVI